MNRYELTDWALAAGLELERPWQSKDITRWRGFGYRWRVADSGQLQRSSKEHAFDRWTNSIEESIPCPESESQFKQAVLTLIAFG